MQQQPKVYAIVGAMDVEIDAYLRHLTQHVSSDWNGMTFHEGALAGAQVVVVKCQVGKVFAAMMTQHLIDRYAPCSIFFTGVAGALNSQLEIGDVVVSKDCMQHDMDATALGLPRGAIPFTELRIFAADAQLLALACEAPITHRVLAGRILTGDQFVAASNRAAYRYLTDELHGDAVEMEGAAVAQVCHVNRISFLLVRTLSDKADDNASADFNALLPEIADNSWRIISYVLSRLAAPA